MKQSIKYTNEQGLLTEEYEFNYKIECCVTTY